MQPKYSQEKALPKIEKDLAFPEGAVEIGKIINPLDADTTVHFQKYKSYLIIARVSKGTIEGNERLFIGQFDAPLEILSWLPKALEGFVKPSSQGGLHPGAMTGQDEDVGGEMLCIQRAMDAGNNQSGYVIVNRSREDRFAKKLNMYDPMEITFSENFLYEGGLLNLIKTLGDKYQRGEL